MGVKLNKPRVEMRLEEVFERVVVINLEDLPDRRRRLAQHLQENEIADIKKVQWRRAISGDHVPSPAWWGAGAGAWGCLMSHVKVTLDAIHDKLESYCVLEDDVVFHSRAPAMLAAFIHELPRDWGQAYLGGQFLHKEPEGISPWVMRPYNVNRTHAYALSQTAFGPFLQHVMNLPDYGEVFMTDQWEVRFAHNCSHLDHQLGRAHEKKKWPTYAPTWWLAGQAAGTSSISGRVTSTIWWHWRERGLGLPFFILDFSLKDEQSALSHVHFGDFRATLARESTDDAVLCGLQNIAREAVELWKLPGLERSQFDSDTLNRVRRLWKPGVISSDEVPLSAAVDYPFNGFGSPLVPLPAS